MRKRSTANLPAIYATSRSGWQHHNHTVLPWPLEVFEVNYLHYHDTLELGLCVSGNGICRVEDREFPFMPGDTQIIFPFQRHLSKSVGDESSRWYWLNLEPVTLLSAWNPNAAAVVQEIFACRMGIYGILSPTLHPRLNEQITNIILTDTNADNFEYRSEYLCANLYALILELYRASIPLPKLNLVPGSRFLSLRPALHAIDAGIAQGNLPDVCTLASMCGMSESTFRRAFHGSIGQAPADYIAVCRVRRAQRDLVFSERSVLEIALSAGFDDPSGFYRCFRAQCGMSPSAYRRRLRAANPQK